MTHALMIARRELRERSFVFALAGVLALLPFVLAAMPFGRTFGPKMVLAGTAGAISVIFTMGLALILGVSLVGRELSERRMSFYFARPVSEASIWFGKLMAAVVMLALAYGITLIPSLAFSRRVWTAAGWTWEPGRLAAAVIGSAMLLLLIAHFGSVVIRSRSPLIAIDVVLLVATITLAALILRPLIFNLAMKLTEVMIYTLTGALFLVLVAAGAWQLSRGRTDIRRNHRALSTFVWAGMAVVLAIAGAYVAWVLAAEPSDITKLYAQQAPGGRWVTVGGEAKGRFDFMPVFVMNVDTGKWIRFPESRWSGPGFSRSGNAVMTFGPIENASSELRVTQLEPQLIRFKTSIPFWPGSSMALSDDARRVALVGNGILSVHDLERDALLGSIRIPVTAGAIRLFFVNRDTVRLYIEDQAARRDERQVVPISIKIYEFKIPTRKLEQTGDVQTTARFVAYRVSADGSTMLVRRFGGEGDAAIVVDARSGATLSTIDVSAEFTTLLADGRIATADTAADRARLALYDRSGVLLREVPFTAAGRAQVIELAHRDRLLISLWDGSKRRLLVVDTTTGAVVREERAIYSRPDAGDDPRVAEPSRSGEIVIATRDGLARWNTLTGAKNLLLGP